VGDRGQAVAGGGSEARLAATRARWDERADMHLRSRGYDLEGWLRDARGPTSWEAQAVGDVAGLRLLHLQRHLGLDTLAWARAGARVTGLDFSPAARDIATRAGLAGRAGFVCAEVYSAVRGLGHATFDLVSVSVSSSARWSPRAAGPP